MTTRVVDQADFTVDAVSEPCGCRWRECNELLAGRWEGFISSVELCAAHCA